MKVCKHTLNAQLTIQYIMGSSSTSISPRLFNPMESLNTDTYLTKFLLCLLFLLALCLHFCLYLSNLSQFPFFSPSFKFPLEPFLFKLLFSTFILFFLILFIPTFSISFKLLFLFEEVSICPFLLDHCLLVLDKLVPYFTCNTGISIFDC